MIYGLDAGLYTLVHSHGFCFSSSEERQVPSLVSSWKVKMNIPLRLVTESPYIITQLSNCNLLL